MDGLGRPEENDWARRMLERLEEAGRNLAELEQGLGREAEDESEAGNESEVGDEWGQSMEGRYTMASEREIHQEYFSVNTPQENPKKANEDATFDDGIELF